MPGHVERYNPVVLEAREAGQYRMYGAVKKYQIMRTSKKPERVKDPLIIDKLVHDIDLVRYIFGDFRIIRIDLEKKNGEIMECRITTEHEKGLSGEIFSSWLVAEKKRQILIDFEKAVFQGDMIGKSILVNRLTEFPKEIRCYQNNQIKDELCDFIAYMHHPIPTLVKMKDALKSARIIDEIMREVGT
jgi:predicted dehydrogenase